MFDLKKLSCTFVAAVLMLGPVSSALAQAGDYPSRRVNIVVPFPPGGGADFLARLLAKHLTEVWKQPVTVENKPGAAGTLGANAVAASAPDGYTLLVGASGSVVVSNAKSLAAVSLLSYPPFIATVNPSFQGSSLKDLVAYAKANPGKVTYASSGAGAATHLAGELFMELTKTKITHVPYKGMGQAVQDLLGGQVMLMFGPPPVMLPQIKSGKLKALAVASDERSPLFPEIPSAKDGGVPGFKSGAWFGMLAPAKTPKDVLNKISAEVARTLKKPDVIEALAKGGSAPVGNTPDEFARFLDADVANADRLLKKAGGK